MEDIKKELLVLKALTDRLVDGLDTRTRHTDSYEEMTLGEVSFSRLYVGDEKELDVISKYSSRKKSQVIRMLIHEALRLGIKVV
jgi:hypothetical protein